MSQPEARFKKHLKEAFSELFPGEDSFNATFVATMLQTSGIPDLFFACKGRNVWVEAKVDGNTLEKSQKVTIPAMRQAGCVVYIAHANMKEPIPSRRVVYIENGEGQRTYHKWPDINTLDFWKAFGLC